MPDTISTASATHLEVYAAPPHDFRLFRSFRLPASRAVDRAAAFPQACGVGPAAGAVSGDTPS